MLFKSLIFIKSLSKRPHYVYQFWRHKSTVTRRIDKILIANRGEIACRVMRTAKKLGVKSVAVYSDADRNALHVAMADEAYNIGPPPAAQSYLIAEKILEVAKNSNSQAVHPGYGFLSENVEFAESCQKEGVIFIGPPAAAIRDMGIKSTSKHIMSKAGVPIIEGYHGEDQSKETLKREAQRIGFPVMIKAVRGGGGKGMRIALEEKDFEEALESARTESQKAFGDSVVLLEKYVAEPRHVEVQVFADSYGDAVYLYERDCSVQRRHQKIIEEAPAPGISWDLRNELGEAAVRAAKAVGYVGAGTVEFILDRRDLSFHFMEMNTRLQVEHPITEMITGTDLVEWQIKIASGDRLPMKQEDIPLRGHAFEARIYAEDPQGGFLPGAGLLEYLNTPVPSDTVRIETGVRQGDEVSVHYDPMIAKLVTWGQDRTEALSKLKSNLLEYNIAGLETNVNFLLDLAQHPEFVAGNLHTNFIADHKESLFRSGLPNESQMIRAALAKVLKEAHYEKLRSVENGGQFDPFVVEANFRVNYHNSRDVKLRIGENEYKIKVQFLNNGKYSVSCDNGNSWRNVQAEMQTNENEFCLLSTIDGHHQSNKFYSNDSILTIFDQGGKMEFSIPIPPYLMQEEQSSGIIGDKAISPMPGVLDRLLVKTGDLVKKGDSLFVLIAMKMEYVVKAHKEAKVSNIFFKAGHFVTKDATIVQFETEV